MKVVTQHDYLLKRDLKQKTDAQTLKSKSAMEMSDKFRSNCSKNESPIQLHTHYFSQTLRRTINYHRGKPWDMIVKIQWPIFTLAKASVKSLKFFWSVQMWHKFLYFDQKRTSGLGSNLGLFASQMHSLLTAIVSWELMFLFELSSEWTSITFLTCIIIIAYSRSCLIHSNNFQINWVIRFLFHR